MKFFKIVSTESLDGSIWLKDEDPKNLLLTEDGHSKQKRIVASKDIDLFAVGVIFILVNDGRNVGTFGANRLTSADRLSRSRFVRKLFNCLLGQC